MDSLSQNLNGALDLKEQKAMVPELPPGLAVAANKTSAEILASLNKSPLFMTELEENDDLAALQALQYEGSPAENAVSFKDGGNEAFREGRWADAREHYGKGIAVLVTEDRRRRGLPVAEAKTSVEEPVPGDQVDVGAKIDLGREEAQANDAADTETELRNQRSTLETLYTNRAQANLKLQNFRAAYLDAFSALRLSPRSIKAHFRGARALLSVDRVTDAAELCARGLTLEPGNASLLQVARDIKVRTDAVQRKTREDRERAERKKAESFALRTVLAERGARMRKTDKPPEMEDAAIRLENPLDKTSKLSFPTLLLYPVDYETDFIKAFGETDTLADHLGYVFPLPWDKAGSYTADGVECYMETLPDAAAGKPRGLMKTGSRVPLGKVLGSGKVEVVDQVVRIFVVPKKASAAWVAKYKDEISKRS